jgi:hypothetical protein
MGEPFEVTENHRHSIFFRETRQLAIEHFGEFKASWLGIGRGEILDRVPRRLAITTTGRLDALTLGDPPGNPVNPGADRLVDADRPSLADQDEESGLKGILRLMAVAESPTTDTQNERSVPGYKSLESRRVTPNRVAFQELRIG